MPGRRLNAGQGRGRAGGQRQGEGGRAGPGEGSAAGDKTGHELSSKENQPAPPRARRKARPPSEAYLERAAAFYLGRYASSAANLRHVLLRKARRRAREAAEEGVPIDEGALGGAVEAVVARAVRSGLVDDRAYAEMTVGSLQRRGVSTRAAVARLKAKGVPDETAAAALARSEPDDLALARRFAERKRLGPWRPRPDPDRRERDLAALCRAGFAYRVARAALEPLVEE